MTSFLVFSYMTSHGAWHHWFYFHAWRHQCINLSEEGSRETWTVQKWFWFFSPEEPSGILEELDRFDLSIVHPPRHRGCTKYLKVSRSLTWPKRLEPNSSPTRKVGEELFFAGFGKFFNKRPGTVLEFRELLGNRELVRFIQKTLENSTLRKSSIHRTKIWPGPNFSPWNEEIRYFQKILNPPN